MGFLSEAKGIFDRHGYESLKNVHDTKEAIEIVYLELNLSEGFIRDLKNLLNEHESLLEV